MADKTLDAKGLNCPLPILKAKKALKEVPSGGTLEILATDPGSVADFAAFCRTTGNEIVEQSAGRRRLPLRHQARRLTQICFSGGGASCAVVRHTTHRTPTYRGALTDIPNNNYIVPGGRTTCRGTMFGRPR